MSPAKRYARKQTKTRHRRRLNAKERHERQQRQAQRDLGLPDNLVIEIEGRLRNQRRLLGKIFALMFPTLFGCRSAHGLTCTRGWNNNVPSQILGALPKRSWRKRLRKPGQDIVTTLWRRVKSMSPATRSRWQLTPLIDDSVFRKCGGPLELVGRWWSG